MGDRLKNPYKWVSESGASRPSNVVNRFRYCKDNREKVRDYQGSVNANNHRAVYSLKSAATCLPYQGSSSNTSREQKRISNSNNLAFNSRYKLVRRPAAVPEANKVVEERVTVRRTVLSPSLIDNASKSSSKGHNSLYKYVKNKTRNSVSEISPRKISYFSSSLTHSKMKEKRHSFRSRYKLVHRSRNSSKMRENPSPVQNKKLKIVTRYAIRTFTPGVSCAFYPTARTQSQKLYKTILLKYRRRPLCTFFVRTGRCSSGTSCRYVHDPVYVRICPKYLSHSCTLGESACPLAHVLDPCRLPLCEFYETTGCHRDPCPYLHTTHPPNTPVCPNFLRGRCPRGRSCPKRHVWKTKSNNKSGKSVYSKTIKKNLTEKNVVRARQSNQSTERRDNGKSTVATKIAHTDAASASVSTPVPEGSLRHVYPPPKFIPLMSDDLTP